MVSRPHNEEELQKREAIGVIRASRFVREYAKSHEPIRVASICSIHREIFKESFIKNIEESIDQAKRGEVYSQEDVLKEFGV